jgi:F0F1-type ATP synthase membrane subunit b/b'
MEKNVNHLRTLLLALVLMLISAPNALASGDSDDHGDSHHISYLVDDDGDGKANWMDSDAGEAYMLGKIAQHFYNLVLFVALITYLTRKAVKVGLKKRAAAIRTEIDDAVALRDSVRAEHAEVLARLKNFETEIARLIASSDEEAQAEEQRLITRAEGNAQRMLENTEVNIREEVLRARRTLRDDSVNLAVELAEQLLQSKVGTKQQKSLATELLNSLNEVN